MRIWTAKVKGIRLFLYCIHLEVAVDVVNVEKTEMMKCLVFQLQTLATTLNSVMRTQNRSNIVRKVWKVRCFGNFNFPVFQHGAAYGREG